MFTKHIAITDDGLFEVTIQPCKDCDPHISFSSTDGRMTINTKPGKFKIITDLDDDQCCFVRLDDNSNISIFLKGSVEARDIAEFLEAPLYVWCQDKKKFILLEEKT